MANNIIKTQLHPQKPADESDIIYPETSVDQVKGLPVLSGSEKQAVVVSGDGYSTAPYNAPTKVRVGETQTLPEGYPASVQNVGTPEAPILNFQIPQGKTGMQGKRGIQGPKGDDGETFYILSHTINNNIGEVTLNVPASEFEPTVDISSGISIRGISMPTGALFVAVPDFDSDTFLNTFTVTTLGYAGVSHGGTITKTLDVNANVHIGRGNPDVKLYVRKISYDNYDGEPAENKIIEVTSKTEFISRVDFFSAHCQDLFVNSIRKYDEYDYITVSSQTNFKSDIIADSLITANDEIILTNSGIVLRAINGYALFDKVSFKRIGKTSKLTENDPYLDCELNANSKRIYDCKINTNPIDVEVTGATGNFELKFINVYDGSVQTITTDGIYQVVFPCLVYALKVNSEALSTMDMTGNSYTIFMIAKDSVKVVQPNSAFVSLNNQVTDEDNNKAECCFLNLMNFNKPISGSKISFRLGI